MGYSNQLNESTRIESETMYHDILKAFNLEVKRSGKVVAILVTDSEGKSIRNLLRLPELDEQIKTPRQS